VHYFVNRFIFYNRESDAFSNAYTFGTFFSTSCNINNFDHNLIMNIKANCVSDSPYTIIKKR
jgi:hypothetical protein